jgi:hypothetical protein
MAPSLLVILTLSLSKGKNPRILLLLFCSCFLFLRFAPRANRSRKHTYFCIVRAMIREASLQSMQNIRHFAPLLPNRQRFIEQFQNMYETAQ